MVCARYKRRQIKNGYYDRYQSEQHSLVLNTCCASNKRPEVVSHLRWSFRSMDFLKQTNKQTKITFSFFSFLFPIPFKKFSLSQIIFRTCFIFLQPTKSVVVPLLQTNPTKAQFHCCIFIIFFFLQITLLLNT